MKHYILLFFLILILPWGLGAQKESLRTWYEKSGFTETPRYDETIRYCKLLAASSHCIHYGTFGKSPQGRDLPLLVLDKDGYTDPRAIHDAGRLIVLIQACIHTGEPEGKDAGLMLFRDLTAPSPLSARTPNPPDPILQKVSVIFIPIFNVDGHERYGPYNRINQNGPKETGWRVTANNLNLNRDYLKADAPEMQAWLKMFNHWNPDFFIDSHTTDGADYQYVLTYLVDVYGDMDPGLTAWAKDNFIPAIEKAMTSEGFAVFPYVTFRNWTDLKSGLITNVSPPMLSQSYTALRNRPGLLIETHMLKPYQERVSSTYSCMLNTLKILANDQPALEKLIGQADRFASSEEFRKQDFPLQFRTLENDSTMVDFKGVSYRTVISPLTGDSYNEYGKEKVTYRIPCFNKNVPSVTVKLPEAYVIPAEWKEVIERLELHGVQFFRLNHEQEIAVQTCRFRKPKWQQNPYEGRHPLTNIEYDEFTETRKFSEGSVVVPTNQPLVRIIAHILEPRGNGSYLYWGFFDATFEQKEYFEEYVMEPMVKKMLDDDPALKAEFETKKAQDTAFAHNPYQILNWFYMKTPYYDSRKNVYPVGKILDKAEVDKLRKEQAVRREP